MQHSQGPIIAFSDLIRQVSGRRGEEQAREKHILARWKDETCCGQNRHGSILPRSSAQLRAVASVPLSLTLKGHARGKGRDRCVSKGEKEVTMFAVSSALRGMSADLVV